MKVLFLITARGGSKGVLRKNIRELGGMPLIAYKIISAQKCKYDKRIIVSTDDKEIADISRQYGAEVPFMRPNELATDTASSMDVVIHAMKWIDEHDNSKYEYVCLLEPSSPFASYIDLNNAIEKIIVEKADTIVSVKETDVNSFFVNTLDECGKMSKFYKNIKELNSVQRQLFPKEYTMNGCLYIAKWDYLKRNKLFHSINSVPYIMEKKVSVEIDEIDDLNYAEYLVKNGIINRELWN